MGYSIDKDNLNKFYDNFLRETIEDNLNAYEEACGTYLDDKLDKDRFKKYYKKPIRDLVEGKEMANYLNINITATEYENIITVYDEWGNKNR